MREFANQNQAPGLNAQEVRTMRQNLERFRLLVENSQDMVAEVSLEGRFLYTSPNTKVVLGYEPEEMLHSSVFERVHPEDLPRVQAQFALPEGSATCRYRHKDGSWRWFETTGRDFLASDGETRGVLIIRDITERKHAEAERQRLEAILRQMHKMEALGTLAGGIAHDFNNLLTVIMSCTELAVMDINNPQEAVKYLLQVQKASDRAKRLVHQILAFSRKQNQERKPIYLQPVIKESLELLQHTLPATVKIDTQIDPKANMVLADSTQIHRVMINLCTNAAHAMRQNPGRLTISIKNCQVRDLLAQTIPGLQPGRFVQITVSDTGHGMDAETLKHIFEPFFTTKNTDEGTGLGLPLVHGIVREHQGAMTVQSQPGIGTTFDIYLPALESGSYGTRRNHHPSLVGNQTN